MKNTFVRWTGKDTEGTFSHTGRVVSDSDEIIVLATELGEMSIDKANGSFETVDAPSNFNAPVVTTTTTKTVTSTLKPGSVKSAVFELLNGKNVSRKEAINMIIEAGISSAAGASTHYNSVKNII